jgi:hypothetical protein
MAYAGACIGGAQTAPDPGLLSNRELEPPRGRAGSASVDELGRLPLRVFLIGKYAFQKKDHARDSEAMLANLRGCRRCREERVKAWQASSRQARSVEA